LNGSACHARSNHRSLHDVAAKVADVAMTDDASALLLDTFVQLADTLAGDYDVGE
jgi:hypothetical protein